MSTAESMIGLSKKFIKMQMLNRVWNLSPRNEFAEKLCKKTVGAFLNFPSFASAHCKHADQISTTFIKKNYSNLAFFTLRGRKRNWSIWWRIKNLQL